MHAEKFEWQFLDADNPTVICHSNDRARWISAEINLIAMMAQIGMLMH
jgi:hypothetical protein